MLHPCLARRARRTPVVGFCRGGVYLSSSPMQRSERFASPEGTMIVENPGARPRHGKPCSRFQTAFRALIGAVLVLCFAGPSRAQFGQNKVQYRSLDWAVLETEHFQLHHYAEETGAAHEAARMAERGYAYLSGFFDHEFDKKIPIILYSNHQDFEQTNVINGFIGESTGGVTESLKGRVTLPLTGSYTELNHVLVHELVHAFQFDMMKRNLLGTIGIGPMPLWMIEGMAEWVSNGMDPVTSMWVLDAQRSDKLVTVREMSTVQDIRVYRLGQALFEVIGQNFGPERVRRIFKRPGRSRQTAQNDSIPRPEDEFGARDDIAPNQPSHFAAGSVEQKSLDELWTAYAESLASVLGEGLVSPDSVETVQVVVRGKKYGRSFHLAPSISPDGRKVLYYTSSGFSNELFMAERHEDGWRSRRLVKGNSTPELESLPLISASADWAMDSRHIVFISTQQGRDVLQIFDTEERRIVRTLKTELTAIANPSFSPDGRWIIFSALENGEGDLFVVDIDTNEMTRLTADGYAERTPRFSPDGRSIIFATDRGPRTSANEAIYGPWNIARMQLDFDSSHRIVSGEIVHLIDHPANDFSAVWSPDGRSIAFISDRTGTYQVHTYEFETGIVRQRTRFASGVIGIVPTGPALSWAQTDDVAYSVFQNGGWHLYTSEGFPEDLEDTPEPDKMRLSRSHPHEVHDEPPAPIETEERDYKTRLTPEYAVIGALYVGSGGAAGSGALLLGDMLGNNYVYLAGNLRSEFDESELILQYANLGHRIQWGVSAYQFREDYINFISSSEADLETEVRRGVGLQLYYPFNRFRRVEFNVDLQSMDQRSANFTFANDAYLERDFTRQRYYFVIPGIALVHDNAAYSGFTPVAGGRWRVELNKAFGELDYNFTILDWRRYINVKRRGALAMRFLTATSWGMDRQRLRIGGPDTYRGLDYGELGGSSVATASIEARFPIFPGTELLRGVAFYDIATSWGHGTIHDNREIGSLSPLDLLDRTVFSAVGVGLRGYVGLPLRFDAALPQTGGLKRWRTFFSIGFDF
jgi:hypothetical protein